MTILYFVLLLLATISFGMAAFNVATRRVSLVALGLLFWVTVSLLQVLQRI